MQKNTHALSLALWACILLWAALGAVPAQGAETFTMAKAVEHALRDNKRISAATSGVEAASYGVKAARGAFGPALSTGYSYAWSEKPGVTSGVRRDNNAFAWNAGLKQELFSGMKNTALWQKAGLEHQRQAGMLGDTRLDIVYQVQSSYLEYLKAKENIRSAMAALERLQSQLNMTRAFFDEGLRPRLDVLQAEVDVSRAESLLIQAQNTEATEQARLNSLLDLPISGAATYEGKLEPVPFSRQLEDCLESAYRQRPDLRMAQLSVSIAGKHRTVVQSEYYPQVSAQLGWSSQGDTFAAAGGKGMETRYNQWAAGLSTSWTLFSWGTTRYADTQAMHQQNQARYEADNLRQEVGFQVTSRLLEARNAEKRIAVAMKAVEQSHEAYRMAVARYQSQLGTNLDVLDAQSKLSSEEASLTSAKAEYLSALASLYTAMGEIHPGLTGEVY